MKTDRGEWSERIGWHLATVGPTTHSGIMRGLGLELRWRNGARKALGSLVATNRVDHADRIYTLTALGALDLAISLLNSRRFKTLSVPISTVGSPNHTADGSSHALLRSNFGLAEQARFFAPASIGNVLSIASSGINALVGSLDFPVFL